MSHEKSYRNLQTVRYCNWVVSTMPLTTVQRTFSGKFVRVTSWNATMQGVFVDETACSRCYKCTEVASSTFEIHRTFLSDGDGWWWLWGVSLGFREYNLFIVAFLFWGVLKFPNQIGAWMKRYHELSEVSQECLYCLFVCLFVCFVLVWFGLVWFVCLFVCLGILRAVRFLLYTYPCLQNYSSHLKDAGPKKACSTNHHFFIVLIAVYIKKSYIDYSDYTPKHEWLEHAGTSTCLEKLMSKRATDG